MLLCQYAKNIKVWFLFPFICEMKVLIKQQFNWHLNILSFVETRCNIKETYIDDIKKKEKKKSN